MSDLSLGGLMSGGLISSGSSVGGLALDCLVSDGFLLIYLISSDLLRIGLIRDDDSVDFGRDH